MAKGITLQELDASATNRAELEQENGALRQAVAELT